MLRAALALVLSFALSAPAARAAAILYATAATTNEVTSYCVGPGGGLTGDLKQRIGTASTSPGRLIAQELPGGRFLYVGENDRVEVFRISDGGELSPVGHIPALPHPENPGAGLKGMDPRDLSIAQAPSGTWVLYVPQRSSNRLATFPLDPQTGLSTVPTSTQGRCNGGAFDGSPCDLSAQSDQCAPDGTCEGTSDQAGSSCVLGPQPSLWEDLKVANGLVYSTRNITGGDVRVYQLDGNGNFAPGIVVVNQNIGPETNKDQCPAADKKTDTPAPCNQDNQVYAVGSDCTQPLELRVGNQTGPVIIVERTGNPLEVRAEIQPYSKRRKLNGAAPLVLSDGRAYVSERFRRAISGFSFCPDATPRIPPKKCASNPNAKGCPCDPPADIIPNGVCPAGGFNLDPRWTAPDNKGNQDCTLRFRQPRLAKHGGRNEFNVAYVGMTIAGGIDTSTLLGSQFLAGRIDGYRLRDGGLIPPQPTGRTAGNVATSPVRLFVYQPPDVSPEDSAGVLYVAAGEIDRVQAYRLYPNGLPRDRKPFAETTGLRNTFPNDVTIVELPAGCS